MIYRNNKISRQILLEEMSKGVCEIVFKKVKDNTVRTLLCTLRPSMIPAKYSKAVSLVFESTDNLDIFPVWDVAEDKWKSFKISNAIQFKDAEEILSTNISNLKVKPNIREQLKTIKEQSQKNFEEKIQRIREQAETAKQKAQEKLQEQKLQQARDIINRLRNEAQNRLNGGS